MLAAAQDVPKTEAFLGYTYVRANSATDIPAFSANGGSGQFLYNFNKWLGGVVDLGAVHNGNIGGNQLDTTLTNFLFGPRITIRKHSRLTPYFQALFGGVYAPSTLGSFLRSFTHGHVQQLVAVLRAMLVSLAACYLPVRRACRKLS